MILGAIWWYVLFFNTPTSYIFFLGWKNWCQVISLTWTIQCCVEQHASAHSILVHLVNMQWLVAGETLQLYFDSVLAYIFIHIYTKISVFQEILTISNAAMKGVDCVWTKWFRHNEFIPNIVFDIILRLLAEASSSINTPCLFVCPSVCLSVHHTLLALSQVWFFLDHG